MNAFQLWVTDNFLKLGREDEVFARGQVNDKQASSDVTRAALAARPSRSARGTASLLVGAEGVP